MEKKILKKKERKDRNRRDTQTYPLGSQQRFLQQLFLLPERKERRNICFQDKDLKCEFFFCFLVLCQVKERRRWKTQTNLSPLSYLLLLHGRNWYLSSPLFFVFFFIFHLFFLEIPAVINVFFSLKLMSSLPVLLKLVFFCFLWFRFYVRFGGFKDLFCFEVVWVSLCSILVEILLII